MEAPPRSKARRRPEAHPAPIWTSSAARELLDRGGHTIGGPPPQNVLSQATGVTGKTRLRRRTWHSGETHPLCWGPSPHMEPVILRLRQAVVIALLAGSGGCDSPAGPARPDTIALSTSAVTLYALGAFQAVEAVVTDPAGRVKSQAAVTWLSSDDRVATVSPTGVIRGGRQRLRDRDCSRWRRVSRCARDRRRGPAGAHAGAGQRSAGRRDHHRHHGVEGRARGSDRRGGSQLATRNALTHWPGVSFRYRYGPSALPMTVTDARGRATRPLVRSSKSTSSSSPPPRRGASSWIP
jgi:hypothetical protein